MQKTKTNFKIIIVLLFFISISCKKEIDKNPAQYVDPFIGVIDDKVSNCVIGPQLPFGSINPSPETIDGWMDGYSPVQPIRGFGQLHASGTGWGKYGMGFFSTQVGLNIKPDGHDSQKSNEKAKAYEYAVTLNRYNIDVSVAPSYHSAIYKIQYPKTDSATLVFDVSHNIPMHIATMIGGTVSEAEVNISPEGYISGYGNYRGGFCDGGYRVYFAAQASKKPTSAGVFLNENIFNNSNSMKLEKQNDHVGAFFRFVTGNEEDIFFKIAVSFKSIGQAEKWLAKEIPGWDYKKVKKQAIKAWNKELNKIQVETQDITDKKIFYTAMYHSMVMPRNRTNDMAGFSEGQGLWDDHYAVWDTWRTLFPLMALINPEMVSSNVNAFINRLKINGRVKDTYVAGNDMAADQGGDNVDNIIADAYFKDIPGINWEEAYKVMKYSADYERKGYQGFNNFGVSDSTMALYKTQGWIPAGIMSTSKTLEYAYNDYCIAQVAKNMGKNSDFNKYIKRSTKWVHLWDSAKISEGFKGFISVRNTDGTWVDIDPAEYGGSWKNYFYESGSWTYSYFMPHQFNKLIGLCGGKKTFVERTIHGMEKGYIIYGNEPAFLSVHSLHYAGRPDIVKFWVDELMNKKFTIKGYPGNDDSGAMSSWYVFSAMGFFPNAGQDIYYLHGPKYKKVVLQLQNKGQIIITAENLSKENVYVQSCTFNGKKWDQSWFKHADIKNGAKIHFVMGRKPSSWGNNNKIPSLD